VNRRLASVCALALTAVALVLAVVATVREFPHGLIVLACIAVGLACGWYGLVRRGAARAAGLGAAVVLAVGAVVALVSAQPLITIAVVVALWLAIGATRLAFRSHVELPGASPPRRPVLFYNPKSGGGKAEKFDLPREARARGIEPIELARGADLAELVRGAVAHGADGLAMAGGDGSQAIVAAIAAETGLPYACIPAGTRNHFALDLGVDRDEVVGALDAFVDGGERIVDLADVNGRVFVNNVSLGLYAEAVQRDGYREAKIRTLLDMVPEALGPKSEGLHLHWDGPDGAEHERGAAILVSNNRYRLGRAVGSGTRPRIDGGELGVAVFGAPGHGLQEWTAEDFEVAADGPVAAGIDGEATHLDAPLRFRTRPAALHVRIARSHPGASPSALQPPRPSGMPKALLDIATGRMG
jgi:diacylglycerol kinase family enzyme